MTDVEGVKTHAETRGNTRDKKKTRVQGCKRGKDMLFQAKTELSVPCHHFQPIPTVNTSNSSEEEDIDNVEPNATQLYGCEQLQEACSAHDTKNPLQRKLPEDLGSSKTLTRAKVGGNCARCIRSHTRCYKLG